MRGKDLSDFGIQVKETMQDVLKTYNPEVELATAPAKFVFKEKKDKQSEKESNEERV